MPSQSPLVSSQQDCDIFSKDLSAYFDNELIGEDLEKLKQHLQTCAACQSKLAQFQKLSDGFKSLWPTMGQGGSIIDKLRENLKSDEKE